MFKMQSLKRCLTFFSIIVILSLSVPPELLALEASDLAQYVGYYILEDTNVDGDFEGADYDKPVKLDNGMIFAFQTYNYSYSYNPETVILVRPWSDSLKVEMKKAGYKDWECASYVLIIEDEVYEVTRIR